MSQKTLIFVAGLLIGGAVTLVAASLSSDDSGSTGDREATRLSAVNSELEQQRDALKATLEKEREAHREELLAAANVPDPAPTEIEEPGPVIADEAAEPEDPAAAGPPTMDEIVEEMKKFGGKLQGVIVGQGDEAAAELRAFFARVSPEDLAKLIDRYGEEGDMGKKIVLAHVLAQSGRPEAIEALRKIVLDRTLAFTDRRYVAHGLAFVDDPELQPLLLEVGRNDPDRGARANASFGLARAGVEEGISLYAAAVDEAFREKDPAAMNYLSGFYLLGKKALPQIRERLDTYREPQTRIVLIELLKKEKDRESLPILHQLSNDPEAGQAVQEAARQAIDVIEAPDEGE